MRPPAGRTHGIREKPNYGNCAGRPALRFTYLGCRSRMTYGAAMRFIRVLFPVLLLSTGLGCGSTADRNLGNGDGDGDNYANFASGGSCQSSGTSDCDPVGSTGGTTANSGSGGAASGGNSSGGGTGGMMIDGGTGGRLSLPAANCGDGTLASDEVCDDSNQKSEDGCSASCLQLEPSFICAEPGKPCMPIAVCGDGEVSLYEQCDDGGQEDGDGCSATCRIEPEGECSNEASECGAVCGDGIVGVGEQCDDGVNSGGYNGCQPDCSLGVYCGDGIVQDEEACDDHAPQDAGSCAGCRVLAVK